MFGNTKPMNEIYRDERLAAIFNAFAEDNTKRAERLLTELARLHGDDRNAAKTILAALDHIAFRETRQRAADFAIQLAHALPERALRTEIEDKARELAKKSEAQVGQEKRKDMTPDEFIAKLGYTPFTTG